jgi:hypothetical protein
MANGMRTFKSESDVRAWCRDGATTAHFFVEPAMGGTSGVPDFTDFPFRNGKALMLELKYSRYGVEDGWLKYKVRPAQKRLIPSLYHAGVAVGLLVGTKTHLYLLRPTLSTLNGLADINSADCVGKFSVRADFDPTRVMGMLAR